MCDRLTCAEIVLILSADQVWSLPERCADAKLRMAEARASIRYFALQDDQGHFGVRTDERVKQERRAA